MGDIPNPFTPQSPPPPCPHKSNMSMLYYGLVVVGTAKVVLAVYNLIILKWCSDHHHRSSPRRRHRQGLVRAPEPTSSRSFNNPNTHLVSSFKYKKKGAQQDQDQDDDFEDYDECPVCLCVFEEREEVRQLPRCKHNFHAACIDMWLFSRFDCPVCRGPVEPPLLRRQTVADPPPENSREGLLDTGILDPV